MINLFRIGQKVVWVSPYEYTRTDEWGNLWPAENTVYTIRGFCLDPYSEPRIGVWLEEIVNKPLPCMPDGHLGEIAFNSECFRPVSEQDIWSTIRAKELV